MNTPQRLVRQHPHRLRFLGWCATTVSVLLLPAGAVRGAPPSTLPADPALVVRDYQHMLDELHLTNAVTRASSRPAPNYDESKANGYPLPDPLLMSDGRRATDAATWWAQRRPEILRAFQTEMYGRIPAATPAVTWTVTGTNRVAYDGHATIRSITGRIDNSAYPTATPALRLTLCLPTSTTRPVPIMVVVTGGNRTARSGSSQPDALRPTGAPSGVLRQLLDLGWGYATFDATAVQPDTAAGLYAGIIGLVAKGQPRHPDDWGAIAAWSWGLSRAMDYLQTDPAIDAKRIGIEGHSRWGKTAMVAAAYDPRWAICFASCSGEGGAKPSRRFWGETLDDVAGVGEYYWMAGNFLKYRGRWNDLPVDSHELMALIAPRPLFVTGGTTDRWADPHGEFLAAVAAGPVYELLGARGLGTSDMPAPDVELTTGTLAFRYHAGGHTDALDWPTFLTFAQRQFLPQPSAVR